MKKGSTILQCKEILEEMNNGDECTIPTPENCATFAVTVRVEKPKVQAVGKEKVAKTYKEKSAGPAARTLKNNLSPNFGG